MDSTTTETIKVVLPPEILAAIERAMGRAEIPGDEAPIRLTSGHCDYSARGGRREHWFRMVWRDGEWGYFGDRLSAVGVKASTRHQTAHGDIWAGELLVQHDKGGKIDAAYLAHAPIVVDGGESLRADLTFTRGRDGNLRITLPNGEILVRPDPRR